MVTHSKSTYLIRYPLASVIALSTLCAIDLLGYPVWTQTSFLLSTASLAMTLGALNGVAWYAVFSLCYRWGTRWRVSFWFLLALLAGLGLSSSLGTFARWGGRYHTLSLIVTSAIAIGVVGATALISAMQPCVRYPLGYLSHLCLTTRMGITVLMLLFAVGLAYVDVYYFPELYLEAHFALRVGIFWLLMFSIVLWIRRPTPHVYTSYILGLLFATSFTFALFSVNESNVNTIDQMDRRPWPRTILYTMRHILDLDLDGYSSLLAGGDCNDLDPRINPRAREIPNNHIDDNCFMGDAKGVGDENPDIAMTSKPSPVNVVLITVDSLVPNRMGVYLKNFQASARATTVHLDAWAKDALVFHKVYTTGGWTSIAIGSIMRGLYPRRLKWVRYYETNLYRMLRRPFKGKLRKGEKITTMFPLISPESRMPLPEYLQYRKMYTVAVVDDEFTEVLSPSVGADRGFDRFYEVDRLPKRLRNDQGTTELAIKALRSIPPKKRFFMWVHYFGPHLPNRTHSEIRLDGDSIRDGYDHEVRYMDVHLSRLLTELEKYKSNTVIFVTADHGEVFKPTFRFHGHSLEEDTLRVPLLIKAPGWKNKHVFRVVSLVDLVPTILDWTLTPIPGNLDGISLKKILEHPLQPSIDRTLIAETWRYKKGETLWLDRIGAFNGKSKVVYDRINQSFKRFSQFYRSAPSRRLPRNSTDPLKQFLQQYMESTGGAIQLHD